MMGLFIKIVTFAVPTIKCIGTRSTVSNRKLV